MESKTVKTIMNENVQTIDCEESIYKAADLMRQYDIGFLVVLCDGKPGGVLTDRDIVLRALDQIEIPKKIKNIMTKDVVSALPTDTLVDAARLMGQRQIRRLVVLDEDKNLKGVVSIGDLIKDSLSDDAAKDAFMNIVKDYSPHHLYKIFANSSNMDSLKVDDFKL